MDLAARPSRQYDAPDLAADQPFATMPGVAHMIFNPGMFAHNFLRTIEFAALLGVYPVLASRGKAAPISNEDMARAAAVPIAEGPERHAGKSCRPTGPQLLDGRQMARFVGKAVGHAVLPVNMPIWQLGEVARQQGVEPFEISSLRHYTKDIRGRTFDFEGGVTDGVEQLTGVPAESFETTARRYAALPFARQSFVNRLKAFARFNLTPFDNGYDLDKWDRRMAFPPTPEPSLAIPDERWRREHAEQMAGHRMHSAASCTPPERRLLLSALV